VSKGAQFWGFHCPRVCGVLGGNLLSALEVFLLSPKSCANPWSESGDRVLDLRELTCGHCSSRAA
jgi:hypothetical protein